MNRQMDGRKGEKGGMIRYVPSTSEVNRKRGGGNVWWEGVSGESKMKKRKKADQTWRNRARGGNTKKNVQETENVYTSENWQGLTNSFASLQK